MNVDDVLGGKTTLVFNAMDEHLPARLVVFGTGGRGRRCRMRLVQLGVSVPFFMDNDPAKQGALVDGVEVLAPSELMRRAPDCDVMVCSWAQGPMVAQLQNLGVEAIYLDGTDDHVDPAIAMEHSAELDEVFGCLADEDSRQAFAAALRLRFQGRKLTYHTLYPVYEHPLVRPRKGDVIIDGGAAEGDTLLRFHDDCEGDCALHLFEPTPVSYEHMTTLIASRKLTCATAVNKALWSSDTTLRFMESFGCTHSNHVSDAGGCVVAATRLDTYVAEAQLDHVDLIKLDIEGAELEALKGAEEVLRRYKPRLQICLYHKSEDLWEIPLYLKRIVPEYRMFMGHHSCCLLDTVLYCVA